MNINVKIPKLQKHAVNPAKLQKQKEIGLTVKLAQIRQVSADHMLSNLIVKQREFRLKVAVQHF